LKYRFKKWSDGSTEAKRTINLLSDISLTAYYEEAGMVEHIWEKTITITETKLSCEISITGIPEVEQQQTISITINNARDVDSSGSVKVEIIKEGNIVETPQPPLDITIPAGGKWSKDYSWIPKEAGDYTIRVTFTE